MLKLSIASGKGGTGKTTVATILAMSLAGHGRDVSYLDCDVEEPNGHIFIQPEITKKKPVFVPIPKIDLDECTFCGVCADICEYNALAVLPDNVMVFPSLCHSCGGCVNICPEKAITEIPREIGEIRSGIGKKVIFMDGRLKIGEVLAPPITRQIKRTAAQSEITVIDAPPGTSCPVIESVSGSDYVILVTEPTPFGLHDLELSVEMLRLMKIPFGVIINRCDIGNEMTQSYCRKENIEILAQIPFDRKMAEAYSEGDLSYVFNSGLADELYSIYELIARQVQYV